MQCQWDIALRDLDYAFGLDANQDGAITWSELQRSSAGWSPPFRPRPGF